MPESAWKIPDDHVPGETVCIELTWPSSAGWQRLLISLLYTLTRGREWDRDSGVITDAQAIGWQIFFDNVPLRLCDSSAGNGDNGVLHPPATIEYRGGALLVMGADEMGQVVTDVYIDNATGELVVEFGPCCVRRFPVIGGASIIPDVGDPDAPPLPKGDTVGDYTACAKMTALWSVWVAVMDRLLDSAEQSKWPWEASRDVQALYPGITFGQTALWTAYTAAVGVRLVGLASEVEDEDALQRALCAIAHIPDDNDAGLTASQYDEVSNTIASTAKKLFNFGNFPSSFGDMRALWHSTMRAIGPGDAKRITTRIKATGAENCLCPGEFVTNPWPEQSAPGATGYYVGDIIVAEFYADTSEGNVAICHGWQAEHDLFGFVFDSFHNVNATDGTTLKQMSSTGVDDCTPDDYSEFVSLFADSSSQLDNEPNGMWAFTSPAIATEIGAEQSLGVLPSLGTPAAPGIPQGSNVAWKFALVSSDVRSIRFVNLRPIYNVNSVSHGG